MLPLTVQLPDGRCLADRARRSTQWHERVQGWLGRASVEPGEGLLIAPCGSIHTFGMAFSIDAVFLDRQGKVLGLKPRVRPGRLAWGPWKGLLLPWTVMVLELPEGTIAASGLAVGMRLRLESPQP
ncbi:MAG TPA: DUF192 domain-containing protein [bacterium]|jgi:uncharacterized membrane protein (UPF0127 family)|nr:DUF192 domain-containing protein [bacterium]